MLLTLPSYIEVVSIFFFKRNFSVGHEKLRLANSERRKLRMFEILLSPFVQHASFSLSFACLHFPFICNL